MNRRRRLFVDLDGVGADFDVGYHRLFGHWPWEVEDNEMWDNIRSADKFFENLPVMDGFLDAINEFVFLGWEPAFLTACPDHDYKNVAEQKHAWVKRNVPHDLMVIPVVKGKHKARFLQNPGDILIDDFHKNITPWCEVGGVGILHTDWNTSLEEVRRVMHKPWSFELV